MANPRSGLPYIYVTWLTSLLSGDAQCTWAAWFKAHHRYQKRPSNFDLAAWSADHTALLHARVEELRADGWQVTVEDQNAFRLKGSTAILAGKPDIVAVRDGEALVVDTKTGQQRHSDWWQILVYLFALPLAHPTARLLTLNGEVAYRSHRIAVAADELTEARANTIRDLIRRVGSHEALERVPSGRECRFCDITRDDCPERVGEEAPAVEVEAF